MRHTIKSNAKAVVSAGLALGMALSPLAPAFAKNADVRIATSSKTKTAETSSEKKTTKADIEEMADFVDIPKNVKIDRKRIEVKVAPTYAKAPSAKKLTGAAKRMAQKIADKGKKGKDGAIRLDDMIVVTAPQGAVKAEGSPCIQIGDMLAIETADGAIVKAVVGNLYDRQTRDEELDIYSKDAQPMLLSDSTSWGRLDKDTNKMYLFDVWGDETKQNTALASAKSMADTGNAVSLADDTKTEAEAADHVEERDLVGRWDTLDALEEDDAWRYVCDTVIPNDPTEDDIRERGIKPGDILAAGTGATAPTRVYIGSEEGSAKFAKADTEGIALESTDWGNDLRRRSVWRKVGTKSSDEGTPALRVVDRNGSTFSTANTAFLDSCRQEVELWESGDHSQPRKYIDYWNSTVPPECNPGSWGGQCSEYVLWNLANIGLIPGQTMADIDKIRWGGRCELDFLQRHPEYGEIHDMDGKEDGAIYGWYLPRPGDICIQNHGSHFEVVAEVHEEEGYWDGYSSGGDGCGRTRHSINKDPNATNHDGYYVFLTHYWDVLLDASNALALQ